LIFFWHQWTRFFPSFPTTPSTLNSDSVWARAEFLFKKHGKCNFLQFLWGSQLRTHGSDFEVDKGGLPLICPKISFFYPHIIGFWCFFSFFFLPMGLHDIIFNATGWISIWSCSLTHTYKSRAKNWTIYGQLQLEVISKFLKQVRRTSNFHEFWSEELTLKNDPKKQNIMFKRYNLVDPMEWGAINFLGLFSIK
jgi:hypothetical protein